MATSNSTTTSSVSKKRKKLPLIGCKINQRVNPEEENSEIHAMLLEQKELLQEQKVEIDKLLISAEWDPKINEAKVLKNSGSSLTIFGHSKNRCVYLYPEEALYLVEMNRLQLFYNEVRLSIQRAYALLLNPVIDVCIDRYRIFKHFLVHGYKLFRHERQSLNESSDTSVLLSDSETRVTNDVYEECCKKLQIFSPVTTNEKVGNSSTNITYDVYSPQTVVQKSCRSEPDYYLAVTRSDTKIDSLFELISLFNRVNLLFAHVSGNSISVFNMHGIQISNLF